MHHSHHHQAGSATSHGSALAPTHQPLATSGPHSHAHSHGMMHAMTFYFGYKNVELLFAGLVIDSAAAMAAAFVVVFLVAALYEGLKRARERLLRKAREGLRAQSSSFPRAEGSCPKESPWQQLLSASHLLQVALHVVQVVLSYLLMLVAMTYNAYLILAVVAGAGTGYWIFGRKKAADMESLNHDMNLEKLRGSEGRGSCFTLDERVPPSAPVCLSHKVLQ